MKFLYIFVLVAVVKANSHSVDYAGRIFNGLNALNTDDFAFRVLSVEDDQTLHAKVSTGVAISVNFGLVVAQAIYGFKFWYIGYGSIHVAEHEIQIIDEDNIKIHPDYFPGTLRNNIAVIKFTTPVSSFIPIASSPLPTPIYLIFGFGLTDAANAILAETLQHLIILEEPILCVVFDPIFGDDEICGNFPVNSRFTNGNQGGPVVDMNRQQLHGLISYWGDDDQPVVGINILSHRNFIDTSIDQLMDNK